MIDRESRVPGKAQLHRPDPEAVLVQPDPQPQARVAILREDAPASGADEIQVREGEEREGDSSRPPRGECDGFKIEVEALASGHTAVVDHASDALVAAEVDAVVREAVKPGCVFGIDELT